jgi:WD40 repeat protein/tetratricopeptide (TPR) repeat protein
VPGYDIIAEVGRGGMGVVYKAHHRHLNRIVALKMILAGSHAGPMELVRFRQEAETVARLQHPNIVQIYEVGAHAGHSYLALEFVEGGTLAQKAAGSPQPPRDAARLVELVARAVDYAHQNGVVHRDLTPNNVLLTPDGAPKLSDFGLARRLGDCDGLTATGAILGTPGYLAPEQVSGDKADIGRATDVYALGAILYVLLTGRPPFQAASLIETLRQTETAEPAPPRRLREEVPRDLETVCLKCLEKQPSRRYASAAELADDLRRFLADEPIRARPVSQTERAWRWCRRNPWLAGLSAVVAALVVAVALISTGAALWLGAALHDSKASLSRAEDAELDQKRQIYQGHVTEARYRRFSRREGQRFASLEAIRKALRLLPELGMDEQEQQAQRELLRDLAISCLTLTDVRLVKEWEGWPEGSFSLDLDDSGELYARSDRQGNVSVRRVADDHEALRLPGDGKPAWLHVPAGQRLLVVWRGKKVEGWHLGERRREFTISVDGPPDVFRVSQDGRSLAATFGGVLTIYGLPDGKIRRRDKLPHHEAWMEFSPDGNHLALVSGPYQNPFSINRAGPIALRSLLRVFDVHSTAPPRVLRHPDVIHSFAWYPDSRTIAGGGWNVSNEIHVWDVPSGKKVAEFTTQKGGNPFVNINRTGDVLASRAAWGAGGAKLWHPLTGQELLTLPRSSAHFYVAGPDGRLFSREVSGTKIRLTECVPGQAHRVLVRGLLAEKGKQYKAPAIHPGGRLLAVSMETGVGLWDLTSGQELGFLPLGDTETAVFDSSGVLWTYGDTGMLRWPVRAGPGAYEIGPPITVSYTRTFAVQMAVSRDGKVAAGTVAKKPTQAFHVSRPGQPVPLVHGVDVRCAAVSPDGKLVATVVFDGAGAKVWEADTGREVAHLLPAERMWGAAFTPDGKWLVVGPHWFEVGTWKEGPGVKGWAISGGCISDDGQLLAEYDHSGDEGGIALYSRAGRRLAKLSGPGQGRVYDMVFSQDGTKLIGTDRDRLVVHVWDLRKLREELKGLGLDWDAPAPAPAGEKPSAPLRLAVHLGDLEDNVVIGRRPTPEHLRFLVGKNSFVLAFQAFNYKAYRQRGRAHARLGLRREAIADYSTALALMRADDTGRASLLGRRAANHLALGEDDRALADLASAERLNLRQGAYFRRMHSLHLIRTAPSRQADPAGALRQLRRAVRVDQDNAAARNGLAWLLVAGPKEVADAKEALEHARRAVALTPGQATYLNTLGVALCRNGSCPEAIPVLEKSLANGRGQADGYNLFFLAICHARLGDRTKARQYFDRAVKWTASAKLPAEWAAELKSFRAEAEAELKRAPGGNK